MDRYMFYNTAMIPPVVQPTIIKKRGSLMVGRWVAWLQGKLIFWEEQFIEERCLRLMQTLDKKDMFPFSAQCLDKHLASKLPAINEDYF